MRAFLALFTAAFVFVPTGANTETHVVTQIGFSFVPDSLTISVGDTVEWVWTGGIHTVTNGLDAVDPEAGTLFDADLTMASPLATHTFEAVGVVPYFCRPHDALGQNGVVVILGAVSAGSPLEGATWGRLKTLYR
jgi:plastocyanin